MPSRCSTADLWPFLKLLLYLRSHFTKITCSQDGPVQKTFATSHFLKASLVAKCIYFPSLGMLLWQTCICFLPVEQQQKPKWTLMIMRFKRNKHRKTNVPGRGWCWEHLLCWQKVPDCIPSVCSEKSFSWPPGLRAAQSERLRGSGTSLRPGSPSYRNRGDINVHQLCHWVQIPVLAPGAVAVTGLPWKTTWCHALIIPL